MTKTSSGLSSAKLAKFMFFNFMNLAFGYMDLIFYSIVLIWIWSCPVPGPKEGVDPIKRIAYLLADSLVEESLALR